MTKRVIKLTLECKLHTVLLKYQKSSSYIKPLSGGGQGGVSNIERPRADVALGQLFFLEFTILRYRYTLVLQWFQL
jgi:hypothetical protein